MATPAKSVQARDAATVILMYTTCKIPAWGIKQGGCLNWKYSGESLDDGAQELTAYLGLLETTETAAIYTLCLYEDPGGKITDKTPADLSNNFRLNDATASYGAVDQYRGGYGQLMEEVIKLRKEVAAIKEGPEENKLGIIGELLEYEPLQPIVMGLANKIADWVMKPAAVGELKRVSGVPGMPSSVKGGGLPWREDPRVDAAMNDMQDIIPDLPDLLEKLASYARKKPTQFAIYRKML